MKYPIIITSIIPLLLIACSEGSDQSISTSDESNKAQQETTTPPTLINELAGLKLNKGKKWHVDSSTNAGMVKIQDLLDQFDGKEAQLLGDSILNELKGIIQQCNMKGPDHDQYHIILNSMLKETKVLKRGETNDPSKLKAMVESYFYYFELL